MFKNAISIFIILCCLFLSGNFSCYAQETITLAVSGLTEQTQSFKKSQQFLEYIGKRIGAKFKLIYMPSKRATLAFKNGEIQGEFGRILEYGNDIPNAIRVDETVADTVYYIYTHHKNFQYKGLKSIRPYSVAFVRGHKYIRELLPGYDHLIPLNDIDKVADFVASKRADVTILSDSYFDSIIKRKNLEDKLFKIKPAVATIKSYIYLDRKYSKLVLLINAELKRLKALGGLSRALKNP